jgi:hypothetical protein
MILSGNLYAAYEIIVKGCHCFPALGLETGNMFPFLLLQLFGTDR